MSSDFEEQILDISKVVSGEVSEIPFSVMLSEEVEQNGVMATGIQFSGKVFGEPSLIYIAGEISCKLKSECARCLEKAEQIFSVSLSNPVLSEEKSDLSDDYVLAEDDKIDLFSIAYEKLIPEMPFRLLCKDDCKGICSKCGKNLNFGECGCSTKEIDSRLSGLSDFFK